MMAARGRRTPHAIQGHCVPRGAAWEVALMDPENHEGLWEAEFVVLKVWGASWLQWEDVIGLLD